MGILIERRSMEGQLEITHGSADLKPIAEAASDITWAKNKADLFFLDRADGRIRPTSVIFGEVKKYSRFFVGADAQGRRAIFGVVPEARVRQGHEKSRTLEAIQAHRYASQMLFLGAVRTALKDGQIDKDVAEKTAAEIVGQMGMSDRVDPDEAIRLLSERKYVDIQFARGFDRGIKKGSQKDVQPQDKTGNNGPVDSTHRFVIPTELTSAVAIAGVEASRKGAKQISRVLYTTSAGLAVGSLILSACAPVETPSPVVSGGTVSSTSNSEKAPTQPAPEATGTPQYMTPDKTNIGAEFPKLIDTIGWTDPYDSLHKRMGADVLADTIKAEIKASYGDAASSSAQFLEVGGGGLGGGMIGVFRDETNKYDWLILTGKTDGGLDYLGRSGKQVDSLPLLWRAEADGGKTGFVFDSNGNPVDIFKSSTDANGQTTMQFKPLGQENWVAFASPTHGKLLASEAPIPVDMVTALNAGGKIDWQNRQVTDASGKILFKMGENGVWTATEKIFKLTDGTTYSIAEFATPEDVAKYVEANAHWKTGGRIDVNTAWENKLPNAADIGTRLSKVSGGVTVVSDKPIFTFPATGDTYFTLSTWKIEGGTLVGYENQKGEFSVLFVPMDTETFDKQFEQLSPAFQPPQQLK